MSQDFKHTLTVLIVLFGTPVAGYGIGALGAARQNDPSGINEAFGIIVGIAAGFLGLILGPLVSFLSRNKSDSMLLPLMGYLAPPIVMLSLLLAGALSS